MFEAAVLLSHTKRLRTDGVAAALQSGGACTLFAEAAGAADLPLPEYTRATKTALKRALPSYASQNNPLDVTGQAAVETDMFVDALSALASDPSVGLVAFDAFPPRLPGETPWSDPVLSKAIELQRSTGVAFVSLCMSPLAYTEEAKAFTKRWKQLPFLQGHRASANAIRALLEFQGVRQRAVPVLPPHASRGKALRVLRGASGPVDEATGAALLELYGVRRPKEAVVATPGQAAAAAAKIRGPVAIKAVAPEIPHKARLGGVRLGMRGTGQVEAAAADVLAAARRGGARAPKVLVQEMVHGHEVLVGAIVDEQFGATITIRPGGALAEAGEATFVAAPLTGKQARAYVASQAERCGLNADEHDLGAVAKAVESIARATHDLRDRITSLEANPLLVGPRGAIAVDALAEAKPPA
jgi:acyl-CoA synthetase (NDP forming)